MNSVARHQQGRVLCTGLHDLYDWNYIKKCHSLVIANMIILMFGSDQALPLFLARKSESSNEASILHVQPTSSPICFQSFSNDATSCLKLVPSPLRVGNSPETTLPSCRPTITEPSFGRNNFASCRAALSWPAQSKRCKKDDMNMMSILPLKFSQPAAGSSMSFAKNVAFSVS